MREARENFGMSTIQRNLEMLIFAIRFMGSIGLYVMIALIALLTYWNLESDPLHIEDTGTNPEYTVCSDRKFSFTRHVTTTKYLTVGVTQEFVDLSTGIRIPLPAIPPYSGEKGDRDWTYTKEVPKFLKNGTYEYVPYLTYDVNPVVTITKKGPTQKVIVNCD